MSSDQTSILIIDDEAAVRRSFADYLEDLDYRIFTAANGRIGLEIFERENVDLVLVDLRMPEVDGLEVLTRVTALSPDTPLIVISGTGIIGDAIEALHHGAWDYLLKPIEDLSVLIHSVDNALEKSRLKKENKEYQLDLERMVAERTQELKKANDHLSHINTRLKRIVDTTRTLSFCSEVEKFGSRLLEEFGQHMLASGGSLYLKEGDGLHLIHTLDPGHAVDFIPFPISEDSVFGQVVSQKKPILIQDIQNDTNLNTSGWNLYEDGSTLVFPLPDEFGEITGILTLHCKQPPPFMEQDKEIGTILASYSCEALRAVRATERLRENEQQFRMILDNIRTGIIIVETSSREIVYVNPTAVEMICLSAEDIIGETCHEVFCHCQEGSCPVLDLGQEAGTSERILKTCDGKELPILKTITHTIYKGKKCLLETFVDLASQKQAALEKEALQSQLRQAQKMEALGTLAGGIAHDFNNILSAVNGYAELGILELNDASSSLSQKFQSILHAGNRAKDLVAQILTFSRIQELVLTPIRIAPILEETLSLLQASLPASIQLTHRIETQKSVLADSTQIHQIVMNLCTNAYHALEDGGGRLTVSLTPLSDTELAGMDQVNLLPGEYLKLTVEDNGTGISPEAIDRIFDPYFSTKGKDKGTGLGLAVVHGIVNSHGGAIAVDSRLGEGTTVSIILPTIDDATDDVKGPQVSIARGTERILFVDDENALVDIGRQMLERLGYEVTGVAGSSEALEIFKKSPQLYDLAVIDLNMPVLTGDLLAPELKKLRPDMPIVLCTGFADRMDEKRATSLGINKILLKPLTMNMLGETIRNVLDTL